jgi:hypothetical protein
MYDEGWFMTVSVVWKEFYELREVQVLVHIGRERPWDGELMADTLEGSLYDIRESAEGWPESMFEA